MPELPEVEVVRAGLSPAITGATVLGVEVRDPRALKRHAPLGGGSGHAEIRDGGHGGGGGRGGAGEHSRAGEHSGHGVTLTPEEGARRAADFERRLTGRVLDAPERRGKFMWVPMAGDSSALLAHLGMSGQLLLRAVDAPDDRHLRIRLWVQHPAHGELRVDFADQRLFGSLALDSLETLSDGGLLPRQAGHIARDPLDPRFDDDAFVHGLRSRSTAVKRAILDQGLISGVGNIYADEALWAARIHPATAGTALGPRKARELLQCLREVFRKALAEGGTSFDAQYVNVNGQAGYFAHSLNAYGRTGEPCPRCGGPIRRLMIGGRSAHFCPRCQRRQSAG